MGGCVTYATDGEMKRRAAPEGCERRRQTEGGGAAWLGGERMKRGRRDRLDLHGQSTC